MFNAIGGLHLVQCDTCQAYVDVRGQILKPHIERRAQQAGIDPVWIFSEFMHSVHDRHLSGLSLEVSP